MAVLPWGKKKKLLDEAQSFLDLCSSQYDLGKKFLNRSARDWLTRQSWENRSGELKRLLLYASLTANEEEISVGHFPIRSKRDHEAYSSCQFESLSVEKIIRVKLAHFFERLGKTEVEGVYDAVVKQVEIALVASALDRSKWNKLKAARLLGLSRNTLDKKIRELKIKSCI